MKAPAFQWYAAEYLADERVAQLSLETEAVYVRLLSYCWREGSIPASPAQCAPLCKYADVKVIKPALALFTKTNAAPGRLVHKRLEEERAKQESFRAKQSEKGAKGGRPRKNDEKPEKPTALPQLSSGLAVVKPDESSSSSTSSSSTTDVVAAAAPEALPAKNSKQLVAVAHTDPADEKPWQQSQLADSRLFRIVCADNGYADIDHEYYRTLFADMARNEAPPKNRTAPQWRSFVRNCLTNQSKHGPLLKAAAVDLSQPTPKHLLPPVGTDCTGRHIVLPNTGDQNMNRMFAANYTRDFPGATIHQVR